MLKGLIHHKDRVNQLSSVLNAINSSATIKELFRTALNRTLELMGAERGSILLFDLNNKELTLKIARGQEESFNNSGTIKQKIGEGVSGLVAQEKKPLLVKNINRDSRFKNNHIRNNHGSFNHYKTNSFLSVPLFIKDTFIGVINITDKFSRRIFSQKDLDYLLLISQYVSFVFERIKLSEQIKIQNAKIAKLSVEKIELDKQLSLAKKFASLGKISSGIAHEINNPLDGVMRYTNLCLDRREKEGGVQKEYLMEIKGGLSRIANIVRSLLGFSRHINTSGKNMIDINEVIDEALLSIDNNSTNGNITIIRNYSKDIPKIVDKGIKHVFINLIKNAYEATCKEEGVLTLYTGKADGAVEIKISDTGCGIPEENKLKIFEPFFTTKGMSKGVGLGLAICYDIIERYNGKISIKNQTTRGTTFIITIPI